MRHVIPRGVRWYVAYPLSYRQIVERDHRALKRLVRPTLRFKVFWSAAITLAGIEIMHMIRKGQLRKAGKLCPAHQFYSLAR